MDPSAPPPIPLKPEPDEVSRAVMRPHGRVYRIAGEFGPNDRPPPEAVIGAWKVGPDGKIVGAFVPNKYYNPEQWPAKRP
jgi:hypothetical protein